MKNGSTEGSNTQRHKALYFTCLSVYYVIKRWIMERERWREIKGDDGVEEI